MSRSEERAYVSQWADILRWDLKSARSAAFRAANPSFRPMGEFVQEATELVHPSKEPEHNWPVYGVSNRGGVEFSHLQLGETFNSAYKQIRKDWFFHNPTRANVGSLGRVPDVPPDAITSPEYQVWRIKTGLLPAFVEILIRLPFFIRLIAQHRVGAVKERLFVENLCEIPIPVLSETQQEAIVSQWYEVQNEMRIAAARIEEIKAAVTTRFFAALGLSPPEAIVVPKAFGLRWEEFTRWGVRTNFLKQSGADLSRGKYPVVELGTLLTVVQYGSSEKANSTGDGLPIIRMNNIVEGELDLTDLKHVPLTAREAQRLKVEVGDILFNRTNSKELVGKCAVFNVGDEFVFASYLIRLRVDPLQADPHFVAYVVNSSIGRQQIDALSRPIIGQANINTEELRTIQIPRAPVEIQREIMAEVQVGRNQVARERQRCEAMREELTLKVQESVLAAGGASKS